MARRPTVLATLFREKSLLLLLAQLFATPYIGVSHSVTDPTLKLRPLFMLFSLLLAVSFGLQSLPAGDWPTTGAPLLQEAEHQSPALGEKGPTVVKTAARAKSPTPPDPEAAIKPAALAWKGSAFPEPNTDGLATPSPARSHARPAPRAPPIAA